MQKRLRRLPIFSVDRKLNIVDRQNISSIVETISSIANVFLRLQQRYRRLSIFCGDCKNDNGDVQCLSSIVTTISSAANILRRLQKRYRQLLIFFGDSRRDILGVRVLLTIEGISIHPWEVCHPEMNVSISPAELGNVRLAV
jgi:hypothetical protein